MTSKRSVEDWGKFLGDGPDRLCHTLDHAEIVPVSSVASAIFYFLCSILSIFVIAPFLLNRIINNGTVITNVAKNVSCPPSGDKSFSIAICSIFLVNIPNNIQARINPIRYFKCLLFVFGRELVLESGGSAPMSVTLSSASDC